MNKCWILFYLCICSAISGTNAQSQATALFIFTSVNNTIPTPVYADFDLFPTLSDPALSLREISEKIFTKIPFQIDKGYHRSSWFTVKRAGNFFNISPTQNKDRTICPVITTRSDVECLYTMDPSAQQGAKKYGKFCDDPEFSSKR